MKFTQLTKFTFIAFVVVFTSPTNYQIVFGQIENREPDIVESRSLSGEEASARIDSVLASSRNVKERIFVVARLGTGEKSSSLNLARLNKLKLQKGLGEGIPDLPMLFLQGERVKGEGRIEFYVGNRLSLIIFAKRNNAPNFTCIC